MADQTFTSLNVEVRRNESQGVYQFGTTLNGVFVVFAARKLGGIDQDLRRAAEALQQPQAEQPVEQQQPQAEQPVEQQQPQAEQPVEQQQPQAEQPVEQPPEA